LYDGTIVGDPEVKVDPAYWYNDRAFPPPHVSLAAPEQALWQELLEMVVCSFRIALPQSTSILQ
jgi:hypothetical protein